MSNVIFCATDFYLNGGYASYRDFYRLVELAGYPIIPLSQLDPQSDNCYIVTPLNDEWMQGWQAPRAKIIHLELEWRWDWRATVNTPPGIAETWCCDKAYAERIGARYIPMGSDRRLNTESGITRQAKEPMYDIVQIAYQTSRRQVVTQQLYNEGLKVAPCENLWGRERSGTLFSSKLMVHVHQRDDTNGVAPLRWCLAAAHGLPILSETIPDSGIFGKTHLFQSDYKHIAEYAHQLLEPSYQYAKELEDKARNLQELLCHQWTFKTMVQLSV